MTLHNPGAVPDSLVGPNHKLLSTEDLDKPLPEGAEYWQDIPRVWVTVHRTGIEKPHHMFTYRIPLSLSDRLRSERDRPDEQIRVVEAVEKGARYEIEIDGKWYSPGEQCECVKNLMENLEHKDRRARIKPAAPTPQSIPWTLETRPLTETWLKHKNRSGWYLVGAWKDAHALLVGYGFVLYGDLHSDWLQRNGAPAGQEVEG